MKFQLGIRDKNMMAGIRTGVSVYAGLLPTKQGTGGLNQHNTHPLECMGCVTRGHLAFRNRIQELNICCRLEEAGSHNVPHNLSFILLELLE